MSQHQDQLEQREQFKMRTREVIDNTDMVQLIEPFIEGGLRQQGESFVGLCPFHSDSNPSFSVTPSKGMYRCWSCDAGMNGSAGGDVVTFVQRYFNKTFVEACHMLAERAGVSLHDESNRQSLNRVGQNQSSRGGFNISAPDLSLRNIASSGVLPAPAFVRRGPIDRTPKYETSETQQLEVLKQASQAFTRGFTESQQAQDYLFKQRGIAPDLARRYNMGYAPQGFDFLASCFTQYHGNKALVEAGLIKPTNKDPDRFYDVFRDRVLFGVRNEKGEVVGFGGRLLNEDTFTDKRTGKDVSAPKYLNSPESLLFQKSELLFGFYEAKSIIAHKNQAIVVEGYMDVLGLASRGVDNAVSCMGVAVSEDHVRDIAKVANQLVMCFDGDNAGRQGAARSLQGILPNMEQNLDVRFLLLPSGLDPDDYIKEYGKTAFDELIKQSHSLPDFIDVALEGIEQAAKLDTSLYGQNVYERKLSMLKRWIALAPEGSAIRQVLARKGAEIMREERNKKKEDEVAATPPVAQSVSQAFAQTIKAKTTQPEEQLKPVAFEKPLLNKGNGAFSRQPSKQNPSSLSRRIETSVEQRIMNAVMASPHAAKAKRDAIIAAANAAPDNRYEGFVAWVSWYDKILHISQKEGWQDKEDCAESIKLVYILDRVISAAVSQGQLPQESELEIKSQRTEQTQN